MTHDRILLVQTGFLGDVILTTPLVAALRRARPEAELTMLVTPAAAPLVAAHPELDRVLVDDKRGADRGVGGLAHLARTLRARHFTIAIAAHKSLRTGILLRAAAIPRRIGFATAPAAAFYTERVPRPAAAHDRDRLLALLAPLGGGGVDAATAHPRVAVDAPTRARARALLAAAGDDRPFAALCPGSAWRTKRWPAHAFAALARALAADGYRCLLLGGADERTLTAEVHAAAGGVTVDLGGATDLPLLAAILAEAAVVVSNDSAPMHVASAVDVPQVAIFCATVPGQGYGPLGRRAAVVERSLDCRPCGRHGGARCPRGTDDCMELVTVDDVRAAVARVRALAS
ncbi:MAG: lipopolysaccharide heptosyltransferase II [Polyangiaceae bacterium UTPRO1]|jgi:heptosyltransferase-2|nr:lipopolysaccharide heptosyltransferase II [Myxococcales bacterium]OQY68854.1 MAG: lipopolysaccharide heptosyltransferase II [Polyangiaceae bacterium UTPRO1]